MKNRRGLVASAVLLLLASCKVSPPTQNVAQPANPDISIYNVDLNWQPFGPTSWIRFYIKDANETEVDFKNYQVHYSYGGTTEIVNLARLTNPITIKLNKANRYTDRVESVVVGSQAVINGKGSNDRVIVRVVLQGKDSSGRDLQAEFATTWAI